MVTENEITTMFEPLARGDMASFLANIEPDVDWTVKGYCQSVFQVQRLFSYKG